MSRSLSICLILLSLLRPDAGARVESDHEALFQTDIQVKGPSLSPSAVPANNTPVAPATPGIHAEVSAPGIRASSAKAFAWQQDEWFYHAAYCLISISFVAIVTLLALSVVIMRMVHHACKSINKSFIGVGIEIGGISVNLMSSSIRIDMLVLHNPLTHFDTPYLLKVGKVNANISIRTLVTSLFRDVRIQNTRFTDVDINYEKAWGVSNIQLVANMIGNKKLFTVKPPPNSLHIVLRRVTVENVTAKVQNQNFLGRGSRLSVGTIHYTDFLLETGKSQNDEVAKVLLLTVLKTVMKIMNENHLGEPLVL